MIFLKPNLVQPAQAGVDAVLAHGKHGNVAALLAVVQANEPVQLAGAGVGGGAGRAGGGAGAPPPGQGAAGLQLQRVALGVARAAGVEQGAVALLVALDLVVAGGAELPRPPAGAGVGPQLGAGGAATGAAGVLGLVVPPAQLQAPGAWGAGGGGTAVGGGGCGGGAVQAEDGTLVVAIELRAAVPLPLRPLRPGAGAAWAPLALALGAELPFAEPGLAAVAQVAVLAAQHPLRGGQRGLQPVQGQFGVLVVGFAVGAGAAVGQLGTEQQGRGGAGAGALPQGLQVLHAQLGKGVQAGLGLAAALKRQGDAGAGQARQAEGEAVGVRGAVEVAVPAQGAGDLPAREGVERAGAKGQRGGGQQGVGLLQLGQQAADGRGQVAARGQQAQQVEGGDGVTLGEQGLGVVQLGTGQVGLQQQGAL